MQENHPSAAQRVLQEMETKTEHAIQYIRLSEGAKTDSVTRAETNT